MPLPPRTSRLPGPTQRIRAKKADPAKRRWAKHRDPDYQQYIRDRGCVMRFLCLGSVECHHVKARSTGGADQGNCVGLCTRHHAQLHAGGKKRFEYVHQIDLAEAAQHLWAEYDGAGA